MKASVSGDGDEYALFNMDSGLQIAGHVRMASDSASRRKGLLGVEQLEPEAGLWILPCEAIHTFGMKMPIDVLFLDHQFRVKKLLHGMVPKRISVCLSASSVVEMRVGAIAASQTQVGHRLSVQRLGEDFGVSPGPPIDGASICPSS